MPCPYANLLGEPGKGVHEARIFGLARNDTLMTIIAAIITSYYVNPRDTDEIYKVLFSYTFLYSFAAWFTAGEILHYLFGTNTAFLKMIGMSPIC